MHFNLSCLPKMNAATFIASPAGRAILAGTVTVAIGCALTAGARDVWNRVTNWLWSLIGWGKDQAKAAIAAAAAILESVGLGAIAQLFRGANRMIDRVWDQLNKYGDLAVGAILFYVIYVFFLRR